MDCNRDAIRTGLKTLSSNCPHAPATVTVVWFPNTCASNAVLRCVNTTPDASLRQSAGSMLGYDCLLRTWAATMVSASTWVGFTLPGMILLPGSLDGSWSSPKPQRGPLPDCSKRSQSNRSTETNQKPPHRTRLRLLWLPFVVSQSVPGHNASSQWSPRSLMSLAIFMSDTAVVFAAPLASTMASCAARASNLFGAVSNGYPAED